MLRKLIVLLAIVFLVVGCGKKGPTYLEAMQVYKAEKELLAEVEGKLEQAKADQSTINQLFFQMRFAQPPFPPEKIEETRQNIEKAKGLIPLLEQDVEKQKNQVRKAEEIMRAAEANR